MKTQKEYINLEKRFGAHNYHPLPVVLEKGKGIYVWDTDGKCYIDCLSAYSAVNQGHCHPKIIEALKKQLENITLTSRAFHHNLLGKFSEFTCKLLGFDKLLPMNTGAEAVETGIKLARKWGYEIKKVPSNQAKIVVCQENFHGRTNTIISFSTDLQANENFGPYSPGFISIPYNDVAGLEKVLEEEENVVGFLVEPIQGEAGVIVPHEDYMYRVRKLCSQYNVLLIIDEIQTGLGRCGKLLATGGDSKSMKDSSSKNGVKADILLLGKALSGGVLPVSAILASNEIMLTIKPGQHGSTFGGNPLGCAVALKALEVLIDENLCENAEKMGILFRKNILTLKNKYPCIADIRGKGLLNAIAFNNNAENNIASKVCFKMMENGLLAKTTHEHTIRLAPPLVINNQEVKKAIDIIDKSIKDCI